MANPQIEDGHTKIANEIMDALCKFRIPGEERQVLDCIFRKTYGWNKCEDAISLSQFVEMTGLSKPHIIHCISGLLLKKVIIVAEKGNAPAKVYKINKDFDKWEPLPKKVTLPKKAIGVAEKGNLALPKKVPTKATITKDTITKANTCPHQEIINIYHKELPALPKVAKWTDKRKKHLTVCWSDKNRQSIEWWTSYFKKVSKSDFLMGKSNGFKADLEWLTIESNLVKVVEGRYGNSANTAGNQKPISQVRGRFETERERNNAAACEAAEEIAREYYARIAAAGDTEA